MEKMKEILEKIQALVEEGLAECEGEGYSEDEDSSEDIEEDADEESSKKGKDGAGALLMLLAGKKAKKG